MSWILLENLYDETKRTIAFMKINSKLKKEISNLKYQIEQLEKLKEIQDIQKIIQERDYYKKKCIDYEIYGIGKSIKSDTSD